jgi:divalent metal cation (Fe/Co/Zn/Cd) transporter
MKVAKERKSSVLESNAVHHRVDSLTGIAALVAIAVSNIFPTFAGVDALGGLLISWLVVKAGFSNTRTALVELADAGIDDDMRSKVARAATKAIESLSISGIDVRRVQGIKAGQNYLVELEMAVPYDWPVGRTRAIEEAVRTRIGEKVRGVRRVRIRFVAGDAADADLKEEFISPSVSARSSPEPEEHNHDHNHDHHDRDHPTANGDGLTKRK